MNEFFVAIVGIAALLFGIIVGGFLMAVAMSKLHDRELERMANMLTIGSPTAAPPEIISAEPDAAARVRKQIHEDRVANGVLVLVQRYKDQGLAIGEEEARIQVEAMMLGNSPV